MKKTLFIISALLLMAASACQKDDGIRILKATLERYEANDAKAYINSDNYACWNSGDEVSINGSPYTVTIDQEGQAVINARDISYSTLWAFYPAHLINGTTVSFPYVQEYHSDDQGRQIIDNPMAAYCPAGVNELRFRNLGALIKVTLKPANTIQVRAIEVKGDDDQMLCGEAQLLQNNNGQFFLSKVTGGINSVALHFGTTQEVTPAGKDFYIVVPANSSFNNLTIAVLASENGTYRHCCKTSIIGEGLSRNHIGSIKYTLDHNNDTFMPAWGIRHTGHRPPSTGDWGVHLVSDADGLMLFDNILTTIGESAFTFPGIRSITPPFSVTSIEPFAFSLDDYLESISLPNNLTTIKQNAFEGCSALKNISFPDKLTSIGEKTFMDCTNLESITIPNSITDIGHHAFAGCTKLQKVVLPESLTYIKDGVFSQCTALSVIECNSIDPPVISSDTFEGLTQTITVYIPVGSSIEEYQNKWRCSVNFEFINWYPVNFNTPAAL